MKEVNLMNEQSKLGHGVNKDDSKNVNKYEGGEFDE